MLGVRLTSQRKQNGVDRLKQESGKKVSACATIQTNFLLLYKHMPLEQLPIEIKQYQFKTSFRKKKVMTLLYTVIDW